MYLTHNREFASSLGETDILCGDLYGPDMLDPCLDGNEPDFVVWLLFTAGTAPGCLDECMEYSRRIVYLSSEGVDDGLEQQTDTTTARITSKLAA